MLLSRATLRHTKTYALSRGLASNLLGRRNVSEEWTVSQLRQEAKERGVAQSGSKAALLARLRAEDVTRAGTSQSNLSTSTANSAARPRSPPSSASPSSPVNSSSTSDPPPAPSAPPSPAPAGPSETPVVNHGNATSTDPLVNTTDEPSRPTPYQPFQSTRTIRNPTAPASAFPGSTNDSQFQPKRSSPLSVTMPQYAEEAEDATPIPAIPSNFDHSDTHTPANTLTSSPAPAPKVLTVSGVDTHLAAPSHPSDSVAVSPPVQVASFPIPGRPDSASSSSSSSSTSTSGGQHTESASDLTGDEKRGLYVLGGILFSGWLLGGLAKTGPPQQEEHHAKHKEHH